jgi:hypothetical protein
VQLHGLDKIHPAVTPFLNTMRHPMTHFHEVLP